MSPAISKDTYLLPRDSFESKRLHDQHYILYQVFNNQLLHPSIELPNGYSVIDSGTGTAIWLKELGETTAASPALMQGCDYSEVQFPAGDHITISTKNGDVVKLQLFQHDITQRLPEDHRGRYHLVHQRFLITALQNDQWPQVVTNQYLLIMTATERGGWLQLVETYLPQGPNDIPSFWKARRLCDDLCDFLSIANESKAMMEANGLECCEACLPFFFGSVTPPSSDDEETLRWQNRRLWRPILKMSKTAMSLPGTAFDVTDEDLEQWASQFEKDCHNIGCDILLGVTVGRKPL